MVSTQLTSII